MRAPIALALSILLVGACVDATETTNTSSTLSATEAPTTSGLVGEPVFVSRVEGAVAMNVAAGEGLVVVAATTDDDVSVSRVDLASGELIGWTAVSGDAVPAAHPIERPAVRVGPDGEVDVAFVASEDEGGVVYFSDGMARAVPISGPPRPETNLVHMTTAPDGSPLLAWLEDSTLSVARWSEDGFVETENVDDLTCDCCNPVPLFAGESLVVAYRDLDRVDGEIVRNVAAVRSLDGGATYEEPVEIADDDWFLPGCPFTGPDIVQVGGAIVVAWMDARQSVHPDQSESTIWVDRSTDGGANFGTDLSVATGGRHRWPVMAVDADRVIHLVWETEGPEGGLSYAWSSDAGESFSEPRLLVDRQMSEGGAPATPSVVYHDGHIVVTWADGSQGYVAAWPVG